MRFLAFLRMAMVVLVAVAKAVLRRLIHGPLVAGWTWDVELRRAALGAMVLAAMHQPHPERWSSMKIDVPVPRALRHLIEVEPGILGGVSGEWIRSLGLPSERPHLLYFHGGGYVVGSPAMERPFIAGLTSASGGDTFSADYRLAPRHPFPAAVDDAVAAYVGMLGADVDPTRLVVVGDSAGGGLVAALLIRLRDEHRPLPAGAVLFSPWVDLANTGSTLVTNAATDYLPSFTGRAAAEYLGTTEPTHPLASPLYADLTGLPPLLVLAGGVEMLLADATRLVERARQSGVEVTLHVEPTMYHVWPAVVPRHPASTRAIALAARWISRRVVGAGPKVV